MGWGIEKDPYHAGVVRTSMTRNLSALFPEVRDEIVVAFDDLLPLQGKGPLLAPYAICAVSHILFPRMVDCSSIRHDDADRLPHE